MGASLLAVAKSYITNANFPDIDDCVNQTCANGGLCVDGINTSLCNCSAGYTGERCLMGRSKF